MKKPSKKEKTERLRRNEEKWGPELIEAGWTMLPSVLLERQQGLGLDATDLNILLQLARHWWYSDNPPRPSKRTIAECMGIDPSTVRRRIARMEGDGLIRREERFDAKSGRQQSNNYFFDGLIEAATPFAQEVLEARGARKAENDERRTRRLPKLTLVSDSDPEAD